MQLEKPEQLLEKNEQENRKPKDDWGLNKTNMNENYLDSQFWKLPEAYNINDLLDE